MSLSQQDQHDIEILGDLDLRKQIFEEVSDSWPDQLGDMSMAHVHAIMDALQSIVTKGLSGDGE